MTRQQGALVNQYYVSHTIGRFGELSEEITSLERKGCQKNFFRKSKNGFHRYTSSSHHLFSSMELCQTRAAAWKNQEFQGFFESVRIRCGEHR